MSQNLWVVGSGLMGRAYAVALTHLGNSFTMIGRGEMSANSCETELGIPVVKGGVGLALSQMDAPEAAILAVQESFSVEAAMQLMQAGVRRLLLEKPAALTVPDIDRLLRCAEDSGAEVWVAYNRRFYSSVTHARQLIEADGGLLSAHFDFTEFAHVVRDLQTDDRTKRRWLIANSSHVIDLAFFISGVPNELHNYHAGALDWHPSSSRFSGSGATRNGVIFSYLADWASPGRWGVELRTADRKLLLQPLEQLKEMKRGSFEYVPVEIDDSLDRVAKPGLIAMTKAFIAGDTEDLCSLENQGEAMRLYNQIAGYSD